MKLYLIRSLICAFLLTLMPVIATAGLGSQFIVTKTADTNDGTCDADCSLREAMVSANNSGGSNEISFDQGGVFATPQTINLASVLPVIATDLIVHGPDSLVTVRRDTGGDYRIFDIQASDLDIVINHLAITNGLAVDGGGIFSNSILALNDVTLDGNEATDQGGGLALYASGIIENSTISNNSGINGGGIYFEPTSNIPLQLINSTVSGNDGVVGTGLQVANYNFAGVANLGIYSCTIAFNTGASSGVMVLAQGAGKQSVLTISSTLLADTGSSTISRFNGVNGLGVTQILSEGYNLATDENTALTGVGDQINAFPYLAPLADNGGKTKTHAFSVFSHALDQGKNLLRILDQTGNGRFLDLTGIDPPPGGDNSDVGAFEFNDVIHVSNDNDSGEGSLRAAILSNNSVWKRFIQFSPDFFNTPRTIRLESALPDIGNITSIGGPGADLLTVRRHSGGDYRIFSISNTGQSDLTGMTISNGLANDGGGILSQGRLVLNRVVVRNNQAANSGGGVWVKGGGVFKHSTFNNNRASQGAGIAFRDGIEGQDFSVLFIQDTTLSGNHADIGGALFASNSRDDTHIRFYFESSTFAYNTGTGTAVHADISSSSNVKIDAYITSSIFQSPGFASFSTYAAEGGTAELHSVGYNLFHDDAAGLMLTEFNGDQFNTDPLLLPLASNGGTTPGHALRAGSPAIDQGFQGSGSPNQDQRNFPRVFDVAGVSTAPGGDGSDVGALEMQGIIVSNHNDSGPGSLRQALLDSNGNGNGHDDILFDAAYFATARIINLASVLPQLESDIYLLGPGAGHLTVRRDTGGDYRIFDNTLTGLNIGISGMTISNGYPYPAQGGGVSSNSDLELSRVVVSGNQTGSGGGIMFGASGSVISSTISGNTSIFAGGGISFSGKKDDSLQIINSTLSDNHSSGNGSAVFVSGGGVSSGDLYLDIVNSTISNSTGGYPAVNIDVSTSGVIVSATLNNAIVANNAGSNFSKFALAGSEVNIRSQGYNLLDDTGLNVFTETGDQINTDPMLGPLADNGGSTPSRAPAKSSPAVDSGSCLFGGMGLDQRDLLRPFDVAGITNSADGCDIGAVEWSDLNGDGVEEGEFLFGSGFENVL